jgi:hypothetical protein
MERFFSRAAEPSGAEGAPEGANSSGETPELARRSRGQRRARWAVRVCVALAIFLLPCGVINHGDGAARYAQCRAMLRGSLSIPPDLAADRDGNPIGGILPGANGKLYSKYGVGTSAVWMIPTALAVAGHRLTHLSIDLFAGFGISFVNPLIVLLTAISLRSILRRLAGEGARSTWVVLLYLFGCSTLPYANTAFSEPIVALLLLWACAVPLISSGPTRALISGLAMAGVVLIKPELVLLIGCLLPLYVHKSPREMVTFAAAAGIGVGILLLLNFVCRGSPLRFSYGEETSQFGPPWPALRGYFLSIDKSLFLFNPALLFALIGMCLRQPGPRWSRLRWAVLAMWAVYIPFYASWWAWGGGMCFGPRFFQSFIPVTMLFASLPLLRLRDSKPLRLVSAAAALCVIVLIPVQIAGLEVKNEEAVHASELTGLPEPFVDLRLLALKLERGPRAPEIYHKSDFVSVPPGSPDPVMDFSAKRTFQYLNNWPLIALADRLRHLRGPV